MDAQLSDQIHHVGVFEREATEGGVELMEGVPNFVAATESATSVARRATSRRPEERPHTASSFGLFSLPFVNAS